MILIKRLIDNRLKAWQRSRRRKPLIVRGARQVGKTYSIEQFGREQFENLATVDLEKNRDWHRLFEDDLDPQKIITQLEILLNTKIEPGKSLLFLDEIQSCPRAIMSLRYFFEHMPEQHVVAAGSLLEMAMGESSFPVGRIQWIEMYPMNFVEYLLATGRDEAAEVVTSEPRKVAEPIHELLLDELKTYSFIGGMPESVEAYRDTKSVVECLDVQRELIESFRQDFLKYRPKVDPSCLNAVLHGAAQRVGKQIIYARLSDDYSSPTIKRAFEVLCRARILKKVPSTSPAGLPLGAMESRKRFKAILVDIGLWQHLSGINAETEYMKKDLLSIHEGAMAEQFVGQEMLTSQQPDIYYWSREARNSSAEVDYLIVVEGKIIPVEVKSGPAGRLRSLHALLNSFPDCPYGIVLSSAPYAELPEQKLKFLPIYYAYSATTGQS